MIATFWVLPRKPLQNIAGYFQHTALPGTSGATPIVANVNVESFSGKFKDELPDREIFETLLKAKVWIERFIC